MYEQEQLRQEIAELDQLKSLLVIKRNEGGIIRMDQSDCDQTTLIESVNHGR